MASVSRYLKIYFASFLFCRVYLTLQDVSNAVMDKRWKCAILCLLLCLPTYGEVTRVLNRDVVEESVAIREEYQLLADQIIREKEKDGAEQESPVMLIFRYGYPHIPYNHLNYLIWPYQCQVLKYQSSFGSTSLFDGDRYTPIMSMEEFRNHVFSLGTEYIAIGYVDYDFIEQYQQLFDVPLKAGQVYWVEEEIFALMENE